MSYMPKTPSHPSGAKRPITVFLPPEHLEWIEKERGDRTTSATVADLVSAAILSYSQADIVINVTGSFPSPPATGVDAARVLSSVPAIDVAHRFRNPAKFGPRSCSVCRLAEADWDGSSPCPGAP